jgi:hypothetical protein
MPCSIGVVTQQTSSVQTRMNTGFLADDDQRIHREQRAFRGQKTASGAGNLESQHTQRRANPCVYWGEVQKDKRPERSGRCQLVPLVGFELTTYRLQGGCSTN